MFWMLAFASMTTSPSRGPILNGQLTHGILPSRGADVVVRVVGPRPVTQSYTPQATMYATTSEALSGVRRLTVRERYLVRAGRFQSGRRAHVRVALVGPIALSKERKKAPLSAPS